MEYDSPVARLGSTKSDDEQLTHFWKASIVSTHRTRSEGTAQVALAKANSETMKTKQPLQEMVPKPWKRKKDVKNACPSPNDLVLRAAWPWKLGGPHQHGVNLPVSMPTKASQWVKICKMFEIPTSRASRVGNRNKNKSSPQGLLLALLVFVACHYHQVSTIVNETQPTSTTIDPYQPFFNPINHLNPILTPYPTFIQHYKPHLNPISTTNPMTFKAVATLPAQPGIGPVHPFQRGPGSSDQPWVVIMVVRWL